MGFSLQGIKPLDLPELKEVESKLGKGGRGERGEHMVLPLRKKEAATPPSTIKAKV